jgi:hypothetical protein
VSDTLSTTTALIAPVLAAAIQGPDDAQSAMLWWIVGFVALAAGANQVLTLARHVMGQGVKREIQQPLQVQAVSTSAEKDHTHPDLVSLPECKRLHLDAGNRFEIATREIKIMLDTHARAAEDRARKLHERIDPISAATAATKARLDDHLDDHRNGKA